MFSYSGRFKWAGFALGFGFGGFFDGILLHQVLQWHHLLSALEGPAFQDIRVQILADGLFHILMYVVAMIGLWLLWRTRREFSLPGADRIMLSMALIGFGVWHVADGILSHWILGIHRIRMDVENKLFWDLLWFFVFGLFFIAAGLWMRRKNGRGDGRVRNVVPMALTLATLIAGSVAAMPPFGAPTKVMVLFKPGITMDNVFAAVEAVDGRVIWADSSGQLWAFDLGAKSDASQLYRHGAILVSNGLLPTGCLNWFN